MQITVTGDWDSVGSSCIFFYLLKVYWKCLKLPGAYIYFSVCLHLIRLFWWFIIFDCRAAFSDDYVYDFYAVKGDANITDADSASQFPL